MITSAASTSFGWDVVGDANKNRSKFGYPRRVSKVSNPKLHVHLLLLEHEDKSHYVLVKDFEKLLFRQHSKSTNNKLFCNNCVRCFKKGETPEQHKAKRCYALAGVSYNIRTRALRPSSATWTTSSTCLSPCTWSSKLPP